MSQKSFISGLEELVARVVSLVFSLLFFAVYNSANGQTTVDWQSMTTYLLIFWLIYELFAYILYIIFRFFGDNTRTGAGLTIPVEEESAHIPANAAIQEGE